MLVLTRKEGESILIGDNVRIVVLEMMNGRVRLGIEAPRDVPVYREELGREARDDIRGKSVGGGS